MIRSNNNISKTASALLLALSIITISTNSLAEVNIIEKMYTQQGYPYAGLVKRSEVVKVFYQEVGTNVNCRVEVSQDGETWRGEAQTTSAKKFNLTPLKTCLNRQAAKQLLAKTF